MWELGRPLKMRWFVPFLMLLAVPVMATTRYVSQAGGSFSGGTNCNGQTAISVATLSTTAQSAGDINWLCGTITSGFTIDGGGSNGNPIVFNWDTGARVSLTFGQIINMNSESYVLFDGQVACGPSTACATVEAANPTGYATGQAGIIKATANGSALANQNTQTQAFYGCNPCTGTVEIRNLIIRNLYQHTSASDTTANADSGNFVYQCSSALSACTGTLSIHDNNIHDTGNALSMEKFTSATVKVFNNEFWHNNWALENSGTGTRTMFFYGNHCHDASNWDTGVSDTFHHNCIHSYMNTASDMTDLYIYNNRSDGNWGTCCTTSNFLFIETAPPANAYVFNNVVIQQCLNSNPAISTRTQNSGAGFVLLANNTFLGCATTSSNVNAIDLYGTSITAENNAIENYGQYVVTGASATFTTLDYNFYGGIGMSGNSPWQCGASGDANFAAWQSSCSGDTHGGKLSSLGVNSSTGAPNIGSGLLGVGVNLSSSASGNLAPLQNDINGIPRPASGAWPVGAVSLVGNAPTPTNAPIIIGGTINMNLTCKGTVTTASSIFNLVCN